MVKVDYFRVLEELSALLLSAVSASCKDGAMLSKEKLCEIKMECDKKICALEDALFCDFITPIERDNIAALAHCISRAIDKAIDYQCEAQRLRKYCPSGINNEEAGICAALAERLCRDTELLRKRRRSEVMPSSAEFRALLRKGREAHVRSLAALGRGIYPKNYGQLLITTARLRHELSRCFDELVEVMLNNI